MNTILERIKDVKIKEVQQAKKQNPLHSLELNPALGLRDFISVLSKKTPAIIAEIKKASPSKGIIRADFDIAKIAKTYNNHGASCISVLTDEQFFQGHIDYLATAKKNSNCPILRKDFIIDSYQISESRSIGADCILLIVALLDDIELSDFCQQAQELGMAVLVESHTQEELMRALRLPTPLIGINNRSLHTFNTDIKTTIELAAFVPSDRVLITESGINTRQDIEFMQAHGVHHFLIGESLMRCKDIGLKLDELLGENTCG